MELNEFLKVKGHRFKSSGINVDPSALSAFLFPMQRDIVVWGLRKARAAIFADTGMGKTYMQLEWAKQTGENTLIVAPLSVARQTVRMGNDIGIEVRYVRGQDQVTDDHHIWITNYEMIKHFDASAFGAVVLDESSILKSIDGKIKSALMEMFSETPFRLCCTATPAPNDLSELGNHCEFLGVMSATEMQASFFIHANKVDEYMVNGKILRKKQSNDKGQEWRLRHHAKDKFYQWMASWAMAVRKPSDLGYDDNGFILPELVVEPSWVSVDYRPADQLVFTGLSGLSGDAGRINIRRHTMDARCERAAEIINAKPNEQFIVWVGLNDESKLMAELVPDSIEIVGSHSPDEKADRIEAFQDGQHRVLITKTSIAGFGMNFQNSHNMVFVGLNDSWESYYQAIRRQWRYGQTEPVNVAIVLSDIEKEVYDNIIKKEKMAMSMGADLVAAVRDYEVDELTGHDDSARLDYSEATFSSDNWTAHMGDSAEVLRTLGDDSIHMSVYSPPFADLYTYSASERDLGNSKNWVEFFAHYSYIIKELLRVHMPGRVTCVHVADIPAMLGKDGYVGLKDFPGEVIKAYEEAGWIYHGWAVVAKNPQAQAIRTHSQALLFVQLRRDSSKSRPAVLDRVLFFRKPGDNEIPVQPVESGEIDNETWIDWAGGIWTGISESDTLSYQSARDPEDEKHVCPLQLGTISRCIKLYSNRGETVLTPFMGIGSEVYEAVRLGRQGLGIELKPSYYRMALKNLKELDATMNQPTLFDAI